MHPKIDFLGKKLGVQQEDMAAVRSAINDYSSRADAVAERPVRQDGAIRSMNATDAQRETELEPVVDGLVRMKAFPTPTPLSQL